MLRNIMLCFKNYPFIRCCGVCLVVFILAALYLSCFKYCLIDDTFITLNYASSLRNYGEWGFYPDRVTNTATSPLNVILTACVSLIVRDMRQSAIFLAALEATALFFLLTRISRRYFSSFSLGVVACFAMLANPLLLSTLGLESLLYAVWLVAAFSAILDERWNLLAIFSALLTLTRPEGALLMFASAAILLLRYPRRLLAFWGCYFAGLLPWYLFSWIHLGTLLPDTFFIKIFQTWGTWNFRNGLLLYIERYPVETCCSFLTIPFILFGLRIAQPRVALAFKMMAAFGIMYFTGYAILGVPPYVWYYAPVVVIVILLAWTAMACRQQKQYLKLCMYFMPVFGIVGLVPSFWQAGSRYLAEVPIHSNWATHAQYQEIGRWFTENLDHKSAIDIRAEIGTIAYYAPQHFYDMFSNREIIKQWVIDPIPYSWIMRLWKKVNFYWFHINESPPTPSYLLLPESDALAKGEIIKKWRIASKWNPQGMTLVLIRSKRER